MTSIPSAQIIAFLDIPGATVRFEAPGLNGTRRKVAEIPLHDLPAELVAEFLDQRDRALRAASEAAQRQAEEAVARRQRVFARAWDRHGLDFAEHVVPSLAGKFDPVTGSRRQKRR